MKVFMMIFFLASILGCARQSELDPADREFADLLIGVVHLHHRYADQPDSLVERRKALLLQNQMSEEDLKRRMARWQGRPEALENLMQYLEKKLEEDSTFVDWKKTLEKDLKGKRYGPERTKK